MWGTRPAGGSMRLRMALSRHQGPGSRLSPEQLPLPASASTAVNRAHNSHDCLGGFGRTKPHRGLDHFKLEQALGSSPTFAPRLQSARLGIPGPSMGVGCLSQTPLIFTVAEDALKVHFALPRWSRGCAEGTAGAGGVPRSGEVPLWMGFRGSCPLQRGGRGLPCGPGGEVTPTHVL